MNIANRALCKGNMSTVFNTEKTIEEYMEKGSPLFLGVEPGLFNTVNKQYPKIWDLYKELKSLDWDEVEFDYSQCNQEFKTCDRSTYQMMLINLAWQWGGDSAATTITTILGNVITDSSPWALTGRIADNEVVHASTYSEIVRMSFDNPEMALREVLDAKESINRLTHVVAVFENAKRLCALYGAGEKVDLDELYDSIFLMYCALLMLERVQFTGSFGVTFTIAATGLFQAIGKAVQKICQDELEIHAKADKEVLKIELKTARGQASYKRQLPKIKQLFEEVLQSEFTFIDYMFSEGRSLTGATAATMKQWVLFNARDVDKFLDLNSDHVFPTKNPCPHLEDWVNIGNVQAAPQEEVNNAYKVNTIVNDDSGKTFEVDF